MPDERLKAQILKLFRENGMRVTRQRELILDIVLENECSCCKEIYYRATKKDKNIGIATVYRMVNALSELGFLRQNMPYCLADGAADEGQAGCRILLKDQNVVELSREEWHGILEKALKEKGYSEETKIERIIIE